MKKIVVIVVCLILASVLAGCAYIEPAAAASPADEASADTNASAVTSGVKYHHTKDHTGTEGPVSSGASGTEEPVSSAPSETESPSPSISEAPATPLPSFTFVPPVSGSLKATGYLRRAYTGPLGDRIEIDYVEFYTGEEAIEEAAEDGYPPPPNEFYIRNDDTAVNALTLSDSCNIELLDYTLPGPPLVEVDFDYLKSMSPFHAEEYLVYIQILKGGVVHIWQQYIP